MWYFPWQRNKCDHRQPFNLTSATRLLDILLHCFLNVAVLLHSHWDQCQYVGVLCCSLLLTFQLAVNCYRIPKHHPLVCSLCAVVEMILSRLTDKKINMKGEFITPTWILDSGRVRCRILHMKMLKSNIYNSVGKYLHLVRAEIIQLQNIIPGMKKSTATPPCPKHEQEIDWRL